MTPNSYDAPAVGIGTGLAYLFTLAGVPDVAVQEGLLTVAGGAIALAVVCCVVPKGDRLRSIFVSGCVGSVTSVLVLHFTPVEHRFYGIGGVCVFACIYWIAPLMTTIRSLFRNKKLVSRIVEKKLGLDDS